MQKLYVLVADDNEKSREIAETMLGSLGCVTYGVSSGLEVMHTLEQNPGVFDAIVLDLNFAPQGASDRRMNGYDIMDALKKREINVPVVVLSGDDSAEIRKKCSDRGAAAFFCKADDSMSILGRAQAILKAIDDALGLSGAPTDEPRDPEPEI